MRQLLLLSLLLPFVFACSVQRIPLRDKYLDGPYTVTTEKSYDKCWDSAIDFFSQLGIPIKTIEKASGIIVSENMNLKSQSNVEDQKTGRIINDKAWIGVGVIKDGMAILTPSRVTGEWNVRVKESDGKRVVSVNLVNIQAALYSNGYISQTFEAKSTGVFEKSVVDWIIRKD